MAPQKTPAKPSSVPAKESSAAGKSPASKAPASKGAAKAAAKKAAPEKAAPKKVIPKKAVPKNAAPTKAAPKKAAAGKAAMKSSAGKSATSAADNYTNPALREKIKQQIVAGDKGGRAGQWSARKAQLVAHEYEAQGGGYKHPRTAAQKSLKKWGDEDWHTADGKQAIEGDTTHRYLPDAAWKNLSPEQRKATDRKKVAASKKGKQFVPNTPAASKARRSAAKA